MVLIIHILETALTQTNLSNVSAIACLQELVLHLICLLYMTTDALTDALTDVCTKCVFYVPDIMQAMYIYMGRYL